MQGAAIAVFRQCNVAFGRVLKIFQEISKKVLTNPLLSDIILKQSIDAAMRVCWNRQTGTFEGRVSTDVWVQVPLLAPKTYRENGRSFFVGAHSVRLCQCCGKHETFVGAAFGSPFPLYPENIVVADFEYAFQQYHLVRVEVTLSDLYLCDRTACDVAAVDLQPGSELFLRDSGFFSEQSDIVSDCFFNVLVHNAQNLRKIFCT